MIANWSREGGTPSGSDFTEEKGSSGRYFWYFGTLQEKESTNQSTKKNIDLSGFFKVFFVFWYFGTLFFNKVL